MTEREIFAAALDVKDARDRGRFLEDECGSDAVLHQRLKALLAERENLGSYLESPAAAIVKLEGPAIAPIGSQIGPYKLLEQIGEGGMGLVYMAEQQRPVRRLVALKIVKPGMDSRQVIARFEAERQALAVMDHPNIATVLDAGTTATDRPYFVMELVKGVPITKYCDEHHLPVKQRLELFVTVCQAIQHAHQKGIIHRDIKPTNVLVAHYDAEPVPKVIDFGVAKATFQKMTEKTMFTGFGQLIGTLEYMSPEQARFNQLDIDTRSDVYSLGVLLYELLTGSTPLEQSRLRTAAIDETLRIIRQEEPPKPSTRLSAAETLPAIAANRNLAPAQLCRQIAGDLDWIVMKCLEKDRNRRYETASSLVGDIQRYLQDEPVHACPPSALYRLKKFFIRNRGSLSAAAGVLIAVLIAAASIGWALRDRAARAMQIARGEADRQAVAERQVRDSIGLARALVAQNKLASAREKLAQAKAILTSVGPDLANVKEDVEARLNELDRFQQFFDLIDRGYEAETAVAGESTSGLDSPRGARQAATVNGVSRWPLADIDALIEALQRYDILSENHAFQIPEDSILTASQVEEMKRTSYEVLLWLADETLRRKRQYPSRESLSEDAAGRQSLVYLDRAAKLRSPTHAIFLLRARSYKLLDDSAAAEAETERAAQTPPTIAFDHFLRGQAAYEEKKLKEGVEAFEAALKLEPTHYWSLMKLGYCLCDLAQRPDDYVSAARVFTGCILKRPDHAHAYCCRANAHFFLRDYRQAAADYTRAIELDPQTINAWYGRGSMQMRLDQPEKAVADYTRVIELRPDFWKAWFRRGLAYDRLGQPDKALGDFTKTSELEPQYFSAWTNRGVSLSKLGQPERALADLDKALALNPLDGYARNSRGTVHSQLNRPEQALEDFTKAIELDPTNAIRRYNRGNVYRSLRQLDKAMADYSKAIELAPGSAMAHNNFAMLLAKDLDANVHDPPRAAQLAKKAVELAPREGKYWNTLGAALYRASDWPAAIAALRKSVELRSGGDASEQFFLAMCHFRLGDYDEARAAYDLGVAWLDKNEDSDELRRFQAEAEKVLGRVPCN